MIKCVLVVDAYPDDDVPGYGGTMARYSERRRHFGRAIGKQDPRLVRVRSFVLGSPAEKNK